MRRAVAALVLSLLPLAGTVAGVVQHPFTALVPSATFKVGATADWVAISRGAVWVGTTGPYGVTHVDPATDSILIAVPLPGEACAGLVTGFGTLWAPVCGPTPALARISLASSRLIALYPVGPPEPEGGVTLSKDSIWLVTDAQGTLARIDPMTGNVTQTVQLPPGSFNPHFSDGRIWVTRAAGAEVTVVDAAGGGVLGHVPTGPGPRFLAAANDVIWTLNQGDGTLTRIDGRTRAVTHTTALGTPGHGGDITVAAGHVWITMADMPLAAVDAATGELACQWTGKGGDSLAVAFGSIWLTDYHQGTLLRIPLAEALRQCATPASAPAP